MISYAWNGSASKEVMREVARQLKGNGYDVWIDEDDMSMFQNKLDLGYPPISYPNISIIRPRSCIIYCLFSTKVLLKTKTK